MWFQSVIQYLHCVAQGIDWAEVLSIISTIILIVTIIQNRKIVRQNKEILSQSLRPYITVQVKGCSERKSDIDPQYVLMSIKNYGNTGATITDYTSEVDLDEHHAGQTSSFRSILINTFLAPNQELDLPIYVQNMSEEEKAGFTFSIDYKSTSDEYHDQFPINCNSALKNAIVVRADQVVL